MEQLVSTPPAAGSFGALVRACRHRALLSQEQLAARAELSERTVRNLEAGRVRSPRADTVRLLAGALQLGGPERESWFAAVRGVSQQRPAPDAGGPVRLPDTAAQLPLTARGFGLGNIHRRHRSSTGKDKAEIIELCQRVDGPAGQLANDSDPTATAVQAGPDLPRRGAGTCEHGGLTSADRPELADLQQENRRLREDVETLKRAAAIFATATRQTSPGHRGPGGLAGATPPGRDRWRTWRPCKRHRYGAGAGRSLGGRQGGLDGGDQPDVGTRGYQRHPGQAPGDPAAEERQPARPVLGGGDAEAGHPPLAISVDPCGDQPLHDHRATALADLDGQRVGLHEPVRAGIQRPGPELLRRRVQALGQLGHLRLRQAGDPGVSASFSTRRVDTPSR
jgi:transcriptional regulator with XRE-family HTH domain